jgi:8-oxo-dGTP pyrophosphatase MutT (NUDIX family)
MIKRLLYLKKFFRYFVKYIFVLLLSRKELYNSLLKSGRLKIPSDKVILNLDGGKTYASVLVIIHYVNGIPHVVLTKRSSFLTNHSGEISFPGGKFSPTDKSILNTAIRETSEEIGIVVNENKIVGCLAPTYTYTSKILIYPFVALEEKIFDKLRPNIEVEQIINLPVGELADSFSEDELHSSMQFRMFKFSYGENLIWGATARILKDLMDIIT